jgi:hypothetical protein
MILMGNRGTKESHDTIAGELVDGSFKPVDLIHQDFETTIHDLVDFLGIELLEDSGRVGHIRKEDSNHLSFAFN